MTGDDRPFGEDDIQALIDGRLSRDRAATVERALQANPALAETVEADRRLRAELQSRLAFKAAEPVPARLRIANLAGRRRPDRRLAHVAAVFAWLAMGGVLGWFAREQVPATVPRPPLSARLAGDALTAHRTFAPEVVHPVEITQAQEAHLVQWLSKRLGRPLKAPDLNALGFRLMGGRLLPSHPEPAAQFMYQDETGARLTLYLRASEADAAAFQFTRQGEVEALVWSDNGLGCVLSGPLPRERLTAIARSVYDLFEKEGVGRPRSL